MDFNVSFKGERGKDNHLKMMTKTGTVAFSAPEIFKDSEYNEKVDIWSAGIVLYMMLCGQQPFDHENVNILVQMIKEDPLCDIEEKLDASLEAIDLIEKMLNKDPKERPTAE